jgi:hypothetical protein
MRKAIRHGQTLTMSPVVDPREVKAGDIVLVKWHKGYLFHMVGEIEGDQFLIVNSLGKVNGWVSGEDILGKVTSIIEPEPRPSVPIMLEQLSEAFRSLAQDEEAPFGEAQRLFSVVEDLRWYADRIGMERWNKMPRSNKWSFEQNVWRLTKEARKGTAPVPNRLRYFIDRGKDCVGSASEIFALFEYSQSNEKPE